MATKSGVAQLKDIKQGRTLYSVDKRTGKVTALFVHRAPFEEGRPMRFIAGPFRTYFGTIVTPFYQEVMLDDYGVLYYVGRWIGKRPAHKLLFVTRNAAKRWLEREKRLVNVVNKGAKRSGPTIELIASMTEFPSDGMLKFRPLPGDTSPRDITGGKVVFAIPPDTKMPIPSIHSGGGFGLGLIASRVMAQSIIPGPIPVRRQSQAVGKITDLKMGEDGVATGRVSFAGAESGLKHSDISIRKDPTGKSRNLYSDLDYIPSPPIYPSVVIGAIEEKKEASSGSCDNCGKCECPTKGE